MGGAISVTPAKVTIDVSNVPDMPPTFLQSMYSLTVNENAQPGTIIAHVQVASVDGGEIACRLMEDGLMDIPFDVDPGSGVLHVNGTIDYEQQQHYNFNVTCSLGNNPNIFSQVLVQVHVINLNDHSPVFEQTTYYATLMENSPRGTLELVLIAQDEDFGNAGLIRIFQLSPSPSGLYIKDFNQTSGKAVLSNGRPIDYEAITSIEFSVRAVDRGNPRRVSEPARVLIEIIDQNDNFPKFTQDFYTESILENTAGYLLTVVATDEIDLHSSTYRL